MRIMKILLSVAFVTAIGSTAITGQDCKYDTDEIDRFTKKRKIEKEIKVNNAGFIGDTYLSLKLCNYDSSYFFRIMWVRTKSVVVGSFDKMTFLFDDETTVTAHPDQIYSSDYRASTKQSVLYATYTFDDINDIKNFLKAKVVSIRIVHNQNVYKDTEIKEKFRDDIQDAAVCVFK